MIKIILSRIKLFLYRLINKQEYKTIFKFEEQWIRELNTDAATTKLIRRDVSVSDEIRKLYPGQLNEGV